MKTCIRIAPLVVLVAAAACADAGTSSGGAEIVRDSAGIEIVNAGSLAQVPSCPVDSIPEVRIGTQTGGGEAYELYRVFDATRLSDGRIAVVNQGSDQIRVYDADGAHVLSFGQAGEGPGEFHRVFQIWRGPADTLIVGDYRPWRFIWFTPSGEFVDVVTPEPLYPNPPKFVGVLADGSYVLGADCCSFGEHQGFSEHSLHVLRHARDGTLLDTLGVFPSGEWGRLGSEELNFYSYPIFESFTDVAAGGEAIVVGDESRRELRVLGPNGELTRIIRWTGPDRTVREADVEAVRASILDRADDSPYARAEASSERPVREQFPAFDDVEATAGGDIWMRAYDRPRFDSRPTWYVFAGDGTIDCRVETAEGFELFEAGSDYLLGESEDEIGVEYVELYRFARPADGG